MARSEEIDLVAKGGCSLSRVVMGHEFPNQAPGKKMAISRSADSLESEP